MNHAGSLDHQYLDFNERTMHVFEQHPQLESLRHFVFKELLVQGKTVGWKDFAKHWLRPLVRRGCTTDDLTPTDVVILIDSRREVIVEALVPVYCELVSRGLRVRLVSFNGPEQLPCATIRFMFQARAMAPAWAEPAWKGLCEVLPELRCEPLRRSFCYASASVKGLLDEANRILERLKPKVLLIASTQSSAGSAFVVAARSRRAFTLLLQHGVLQPVYFPVIADKMLTWGESSNDVLIRLGVGGERLAALGSPRHDTIVPAGNGLAREALLDSISKTDKPTFVFFSNGNDLVRNGHAPKECAKWLEAAAGKYSGVNVVVRLHPNEDGSLYENCPHLTIRKGSPDLSVMLEGSDWIGSLCSTVLYDALLFEKPVWQFYAGGWPELADNWRCGLATRVASEAELISMVGNVLREGCRPVEAGRSSRVFANHGYATRAVADFVEQHSNGADVMASQRLGSIQERGRSDTALGTSRSY